MEDSYIRNVSQRISKTEDISSERFAVYWNIAFTFSYILNLRDLIRNRNLMHLSSKMAQFCCCITAVSHLSPSNRLSYIGVCCIYISFSYIGETLARILSSSARMRVSGPKVHIRERAIWNQLLCLLWIIVGKVMVRWKTTWVHIYAWSSCWLPTKTTIDRLPETNDFLLFF